VHEFNDCGRFQWDLREGEAIHVNQIRSPETSGDAGPDPALERRA
jgi:hypothetical protein